MALPLRLLGLLAVFALATLPARAQSLGAATCVGGLADEDANPATPANNFPCNQVNMLAHVPLSTFAVTGSAAPSSANEVWGWTDPQTGKEYALVGLSNGVAFVDISNPSAPVFVGKLPQPSGISSSSWRTFRVYNNHLFVGSEATNHGVQVFNLGRLRTVTSPPVAFTQDARYTGVSRSHTLVTNEQTGYLYIAGGNGSNSAGCNGGGLHIVDVRNPLTPVFAGCYDARGYTHEAQCLTYNGPDTDYTGRSLCFQYQGSSRSMAIVDVTNPASPVFISETTYPASSSNYSHQGWLTDDGRHVLINDEFDKATTGTRTIVMNVEDLDDPTHVGSYYGSQVGVYAHNLYIRGEYAFLSNYTGGLHVVDISSRNPATFTEVGYFDTLPYRSSPSACPAPCNTLSYNGQWHNYPFFASGNVITTDIQNGLFVLRTPGITTSTEGAPQTGFSLSPATPNPASGTTQLTLTVDRPQQVRAEAFDALGRRVAVVFEGAVAPAAPTALVFDATDLPAGAYVVRVTGEGFVQNTRVTVAH